MIQMCWMVVYHRAAGSHQPPSHTTLILCADSISSHVENRIILELQGPFIEAWFCRWL